MARTPKIVYGFTARNAARDRRKKTALLINPPVYDTQYWAEWSQPYGLLRIGAWLRNLKYKRVVLFDFLETDEARRVPSHRIRPDETYAERNKPTRPIPPITVSKNGDSIELFKKHFGKTWREFDAWLDQQGFSAERPPNEVWISAVMTYWWESVRDLTVRLKRRFGKKTKVILGGIYPTLCPEHAAEMTQADVVVVGEVPEANDLWTDLSLYEHPPDYAVITPSRGCPYNCAYCAQRKLNNGVRKVRHRDNEDILAEMKHKYDTWGIRDFAFYADALLTGYRRYFIPLLKMQQDLPFRLYAPEGMDAHAIAGSQELADLLKAAHFKKIYLPVEAVDEGYLRSLNRSHARLRDVVTAADRLRKAGFAPRNMDINGFVLYGLPREKIDNVVKTIIFVSEVIGSIIPMLFTPVPGTRLYQDYVAWFRQRRWDRDLQMLNGKLYPFLEINEGSLRDYVDLQRLMYMLNSHHRSRSFQLFGDTRVSAAFRENLSNGFEPLLRQVIPVSRHSQAEDNARESPSTYSSGIAPAERDCQSTG